MPLENNRRGPSHESSFRIAGPPTDHHERRCPQLDAALPRELVHRLVTRLAERAEVHVAFRPQTFVRQVVELDVLGWLGSAGTALTCVRAEVASPACGPGLGAHVAQVPSREVGASPNGHRGGIGSGSPPGNRCRSLRHQRPGQLWVTACSSSNGQASSDRLISFLRFLDRSCPSTVTWSWG